MKEVLILTGACGVGKTSTAIAWAKLKNGAVIECDYLTEWIYNKDFPNWTLEEEKFVASLTSKMAIEYLDFGMSVAIENVWSPLGIKILVNHLKSQVKSIKVVWLFCEINENHKRDEQRIPENQMKERVDIVNKELASYDWPEHSHKLDTSDLSINQTLEIIEQLKM